VGQLGTGDTAIGATRATVAGNHRFVTIAAGPAHTCAVDEDGLAWCWGNNAEAELGIGTAVNQDCAEIPCQLVPVRVATDVRFTALSGGDFFTCGLARSGQVYCWGLNDADQLANDAASDDCGLICSRTPIVAAGGTQFVQVAAFRNGACGLDTSGGARCWGMDVITRQHSSTPSSYAINRRFIQLTASGNHVCALADDHTAWCWGVDALGAGAMTLESDHPVQVAGSHHFSALASARLTTCGLDREADGKAWCWGANADGAAGQEPAGVDVRFDEPAPVLGSWRFTTLTGGFRNYCGVTTTGATACWGRGDEGQLLNGGASSAEPVVVE